MAQAVALIRVRTITLLRQCGEAWAGRLRLQNAWSQKVFDALVYCNYNKSVQIEFDHDQRDKNLAGRGLDFARAAEVFAGLHFTAEDARADYGESRFITAGMLDDRMVVMVWTPRGAARRIISLRKANEREQARYARHSG